MAVLYRDYRPKNFSEIIGQEPIKTTLQNSIRRDSIAHAYLFTGPRGTGKTTTARIFARAINCEVSSGAEPCNNCSLCRQFLVGNSLDLVEIDAASNTGVENIRELIETLKFSPAQAKYKVFVIDEVHMLSKGAFNALLKTLEEPPAHAVFILATTEIHKVPATIISRTQRFDFRKISADEIYNHLLDVAKNENINLDQTSLRLIANSSDGSIRDSLSILGKLALFESADIKDVQRLLGITNLDAAQNLLGFVLEKNAGQALNFLEELFAAGVDPVQFNKDFLEYLRKLLMLLNGASNNFALDSHQSEVLQRQANLVSQNQLLNIIRLFLKANKDFQFSPSLDLPLEIAVAEACLVHAGSASLNGAVAAQTGSKSYSGKEDKEDKTAVSKAELDETNIHDSPDALPAKAKARHFKQVKYEELLSAWPAIMEKVKSEQSALLVVLNAMNLEGISENNVVTLSSTYRFHCDSLGSAKNRAILIKILNQQFDTELSLNVALKTNQIEDRSDSASIALEVFGGEIIKS